MIAPLLALVVAFLVAAAPEAGAFQLLRTDEATIADIQAALKARTLTCRALVQMYLDRIEAYDKKGPALNAIVTVNADALKTADALDAQLAQSGPVGPLHCVPMIMKDNYDTVDMPTSAGSLSLKGSMPPRDAFQVRKLREAGAIMLAKSNMAEFAFDPFETVGSLLPGYTKNPYALDRVTAGSSGGTAAAVAANLGAVGLGTDTGNSIRGPASHTSLVGIRSTMGLASRDGIIPLYLRNDIGGPMARTVEDAVRVLEVIAGYDPADPITRASEGKVPKNYTQFLKKSGLKGARLGVFRRYIDAPTTDPQIKALVAKAIEDLKAQGAIIVDPFDVPNYDELTKDIWCNSFHYDVNNYLASLGEKGKYKNLTAIVESGLYSPYIERRLKDAIKTMPQSAPCKDLYTDPRNIAFREALLKAMEKDRLDAIIYPTWSNPPRKIGDLQSPAGDNSQMLSPQTGFPAITVPMGYTNGSLPAGLTFLGKLFGEPNLIKFVYSYEQATRHRRPPEKFPPVEDR